ncbi:helix-turn-helix transcriptional regulator [Nocardia acidivorans]|uniref:helix-turn-helix transcriptional regulator n=1 Tax=Nocardia acidivorans TaxID=404580 RepID=UPI00082C6E48|nr:LuxR family transcriptional regulator [Nocardia acidivorans]
MFYGRSEESLRIGALLDGARAARGAALVLLGEPGAGKSALLDHTAEQAGSDCRVLRCAGVETESELPFAGLQMLLQPVLDRLDALADAPRNALRRAFGMSAEPAADRFAVGMATVALLAELSAAGPVLCLIDDAQWLDTQTVDALLFAAHRIETEGAVLLFAARPPFDTVAVPSIPLAPLDPANSRALLYDRFPELTLEVRDRVLAEADGNPLAVVELPRMGVDSRPVGPLPLPDRLISGYRKHIAAQPESARVALLVSAAEETGSPELIRAALARLGWDERALAAAVESCMITVTDRVLFRHPLKRAAAYEFAPFTQRLAAHAAIAAALVDDPDRRAWHLAFATPVPDESVAAALEAAAERALWRAAHGAAATAYERAAQLSPDRITKARRMIQAVSALVDAGRPEQALTLAERIDPTVAEALERARLRDLRAHIAFESGALGVAYTRWLGVAAELAATEPEGAARALLDAARAAWTAGDLPGAQVAQQRMSALALSDSWQPLLAAVRGPNLLYAMELRPGIELIRAGVAATRDTPDPATRFLLGLLCSLTADTEQAHELLTGVAADYTDLGMVGRLPAVLASLGTLRMLLGRFEEAESICTEAARIAEGSGQPNRVSQAESILAVLAAVRGDQERCRALADVQTAGPGRAENTIDFAHREWALLLSDLAQGRYEAAVHRGEALTTGPIRPLGQWPHLLADRVEAALRWRDPGRATVPLQLLRRYAEAADTPWTTGLLLRCDAQITGDPALFERALIAHDDADRPFDHARTALLYGEWLRRERRLLDARTQLTRAASTFEALGAHPWAARAHAECRAAGDPLRPDRDVPAAGDPVRLLTPQELQVVRLAAQGATNNEIGAQLCLSPKTVGHHLYRAFPKLGVRSRVELARFPLG